MSEAPRVAVGSCPWCQEVVWSEHADPNCPKCRAPLPDFMRARLPRLQGAGCRQCGSPLLPSAKFCTACGATQPGPPPPPRPATDPNPVPPIRPVFAPPAPAPPAGVPTEVMPSPAGGREAVVVMQRYDDAYRQARFLVGLGKFVKIVGFVVAGLILVGGVGFAIVVVVNARRDDEIFAALGVAVGALVAAVFYGGLIYIAGVMVSAFGQHLRASLDTAINTSPFLAADQKARAMSL